MDFLFLPFITMMVLNPAPEAKVTVNQASNPKANSISIKQDLSEQEKMISVYRNGEVVDFTKSAGLNAKEMAMVEEVADDAVAASLGLKNQHDKAYYNKYGDALAALTFSSNEKFLDGDLISFRLFNCADPKIEVSNMEGLPSLGGDFKIPTKANGASKALVSVLYEIKNTKNDNGLCWQASVKRDLVTIGKLKEPVKFDPKKEMTELVLLPVK